MKTFILLFILLVSTALGASRPDVIRPKTSFQEAAALLKKHHAKPTTIQVEYPDDKENRRIEHFILADDRTIELSMTRKKEGADWTIKAIFEVVWPHPEESREKKWRKLKELILEEPIQSSTAQRP